MSTTTTETAAVTERPIIFSAAMVRAILAGRKTQTRRLVKLNEDASPSRPHGAMGSRLWVKETHAFVNRFGVEVSAAEAVGRRHKVTIVYRADERHVFRDYDGNEQPAEVRRWRSPIYMPRWASRVTLEITDVRVERVQSISEDDAQAEGIASEELPWDPDNFHRPGSYGYVSGIDPEGLIYHTRVEAFGELWDSIHGKGAWDANSWVWVLTFRRLEVPHA